MKNKIKKWHIALMSFMALFIAIFASLFSLRADTVDEETGEVLTDNWELNTVFYDSTIDNGKTPLTEINWDASDGGYGKGTPRVITMQINYKNTSAVTTYQPGELTISINNLLYGSEPDSWDYWDEYPDSAHLSYSVILGANDDTHTNYEWNFDSYSARSYNYVFTNANVIEENSNFEGSIVIEYTITPLAETEMDHNYHPYIEEYKDSCTHTFSKMVQASLSYTKITEESTEQINISSNTISFNYIRTYTHPWQEGAYTFTKSAEKLSSYDELPSTVTNVNNYYWVKYTFYISYKNNSWNNATYPYVPADLYITDVFNEGCVVCTLNGEEVEHEGTTYFINTNDSSSTWYAYRYIIVGYPRSFYNEENNNLELTNYAELYGNYKNGTNDVYQDDASVSLNLNDYVFSYSNNQYSISKDIDDFDYSYYKPKPLYYQNLTGDLDLGYGGERRCEINFSTKYSGEKYDVKVGDDILYISNVDGSYRKLEEDEYYFTSISVPNFKNGANVVITEKYTVELWIRRAGNTNFELYDSFLNNEKTFTFTENNIVDFYILVKDVTSDLISYRKYNSYSNSLYSNIVINANNIATNGTLFNFCYLEVYKNGQLVNEPTIDSYANLITNTNIAQYDIDTYGNYRQRAVASISYSYYESIPIAKKIKTNKYMYDFTQDAANEVFKGKSELYLYALDTVSYVWSDDYVKYYENDTFDPNDGLTSFNLYDLLPLGMELTSTNDEIINSVWTHSEYNYNNNCYYEVYDMYKVPYTAERLKELIKKNTNIEVIENWNNTGRTWLHINVDLSSSPIYILNYSTTRAQWDNILSYTYSYQVSYDSYLEYGATWENHSYLNTTGNIVLDSTISDDGIKDSDETDINQNNDTTEVLSYATASKTISSVISTHQDVTTYVKTDQSNYSTGIVDSSCNSEYEYKLRVRTGSADITNLVIYTSIEEAQPKRTRWYGEFLGIDTTYAENKGYTVKVWYSPNAKVGTLADDTSWQVYNETTVDKSKVKSLAFQYLVETDDTTGTSADAITPATLPANSLTYVLIKMKTPADENIKTLARMDCWTQWNALDDYDQPVDFITGINSNVVKVALPNSIKADDLPSISLKFTKEIQGETTDFENLKLNKADEHIFMIRLTSLTANDDGTYNQVAGLLSSTQGLVITQIPIGTYLLEELGDNYFDFVEFTNNNDPEIIIEGVTFEKTDQGYIITVSEDLAETVEFNIKVTNKTEDERFYEEKYNKGNLFLINKTGIDHNVPEE